MNIQLIKDYMLSEIVGGENIAQLCHEAVKLHTTTVSIPGQFLKQEIEKGIMPFMDAETTLTRLDQLTDDAESGLTHL